MNAYEIIGWLGRHAGRSAHLCLDSRHIQAGDVFFALKGKTSDGRNYIDKAIENGAAVVVYEERDGNISAEVEVPCLPVDNLAAVLGGVAHHWYREPSHRLSVVAVTGTNGKTSCVHWIAAALNGQGVACGTIGTLGVISPDGTKMGGELTTPDVLTMHRSLAALRDAGAAVVALEASSIGIDQGRLDQVKIEIAAFTNLTHDHIDYHLSHENYKAAKLKLFKWPHLGAAIINFDDPAASEILQATTVAEPLTYSLETNSEADIQASNIQTSGYGLVFNLNTQSGSAQILTRLVGLHNVSNILLVAAVLRQLGWGMARTVRALSTLSAVDGRLQIVEPPDCGDSGTGGPMVVVDYSHTPDSLERALMALSETASVREGKLICVFGCGGARDASKRPVMGKIAASLADVVILTNDNPRNEDPASIIDQIVAGMPATPLIEPDRAQAILQAVWQASDKDVVLIAGKGHETTQEFANYTILFDDREWAKIALLQLRNVTISTDSRSIEQGQLFWAIDGENFDGHDYVNDACMSGACAAVVNQKDASIPLVQIEVGNTRSALAKCAAAWRSRFKIPVIGITGSNGKTTTKEMVATILRQWQGDEFILATIGNLNNDLGVPLTLLRMRPNHLVAVIEMGMNHPGEIESLTAIAQPTAALVNNAQREHQEFMHTVEAVAQENGTVLAGLPEDGIAIFPGDDAYTSMWSNLSGSRKQVNFGFSNGFDVYAEQIQVKADRTEFVLHTATGSNNVTLRAQGLHNLRNALAAVSCALAVNVPFPMMVRGLESFDPVSGRMHASEMPDGMQLIDDTYNANPDSVRAAIDVLAGLEGTRVLVLGDMAEVGEQAAVVHAEVGAYAKECGVHYLLTLGTDTLHSVQAFGANATSFQDLQKLLEQLFSLLPANVLVKGSRSARMERVVKALGEHLTNPDEGDNSAT